MADTSTKNGDIVDFALQCQAAITSCNADKSLLDAYLVPIKPTNRCKWYQLKCKNN